MSNTKKDVSTEPTKLVYLGFLTMMAMGIVFTLLSIAEALERIAQVLETNGGMTP